VVSRRRAIDLLWRYDPDPATTVGIQSQIDAADQQLPPRREFTFDVSAKEMAEGGQFIRRLLLGPFHPTTKLDHCDPTGADDD
jgi:hypothetical protein